jgi:FkbM family methyltransferase
MLTTLFSTNPKLDIDIQLDNSWMSPTIYNVLANDRYERIEREMVEAAVRPFDSVVELGAGLGVISAMCARVCGDDYVHAYEANPKMIPYIEETYRLNKVNPVLKNAILGREEGSVPFYLHKDFWESSTVPFPGGEIVNVPVVNGSDALINCTFLICDIEGGEADLFKGLDLPASLKKILVETHPRIVGEKALDRLLADFYANGFELVGTGGDVWFLARS